MRTLRRVTLCLGVCSLWDQGSPRVLNRTTPSNSCMSCTHRLLQPLLSRVPQDHQSGLVSCKSTMRHGIFLYDTRERELCIQSHSIPFHFSKSVVRFNCQRSISVRSVFIDRCKKTLEQFSVLLGTGLDDVLSIISLTKDCHKMCGPPKIF